MVKVLEVLKQKSKSYDICIDKNREAHPILDQLIQLNLFKEIDFKKDEIFTLTFKDNVLSILYSNQKPICVDFSDPQVNRQFTKTSRKDMACKALGLKQNQKYLIDLTAGFGKDSFIVSKYFQRVTWVERNPVMYLLLEDGLRRLKESDFENADKFELYFGEADEFLRTLKSNQEPTLYFDFMFSVKKSKSNKEMFFLKNMTQNETSLQIDEYLNLALQIPPVRIALKAKEYQGHLKTKHIYEGSTISYFIF